MAVFEFVNGQFVQVRGSRLVAHRWLFTVWYPFLRVLRLLPPAGGTSRFEPWESWLWRFTGRWGYHRAADAVDPAGELAKPDPSTRVKE